MVQLDTQQQLRILRYRDPYHKMNIRYQLDRKYRSLWCFYLLLRLFDRRSSFEIVWHPTVEMFCLDTIENQSSKNVFSMLWNKSPRHRRNSFHRFRSKYEIQLVFYSKNSSLAHREEEEEECFHKSCKDKEHAHQRKRISNEKKRISIHLLTLIDEFYRIYYHFILFYFFLINKKSQTSVVLTVSWINWFVRLVSRANLTTLAAKFRKRWPVYKRCRMNRTVSKARRAFSFVWLFASSGSSQGRLTAKLFSSVLKRKTTKSISILAVLCSNASN